MNTHITSDVYTTNASRESLMQFLSNTENHTQLMPEQIINFKAGAGTLSYTIKGTADLQLRIKEQTENALVLEPYERIPFPFLLTWSITDKGNTREIKASLEAEMNFFIKMVAEKPLENFLNHQARRLKEIADAQA